MTKNLFLRLCLMMAVVLSTYSCQQDILHEQETYNNKSAFQLTSKRISLDEAEHKAKLLPEIEQVEKKFKAKTKSSAFGKLVNYGNGVSINTDDVIYIENGTGFHSYTFNIKHYNAAADAPVENLILSPLADGTYRELLLTYNLTLQEKQLLESGISVDTHGKISITELAQGTYSNSGILSKTNMSCEWIEEPSYSACSSNEHFNGEALVSQGGPCKATTPSQLYTVVTYRCTALPVDTSLGENGEGGGSMGPVSGLGGNPEEIPTQPNLPVRNNPCAKIKTQSADVNFQSNMTNLKGKTGLKKETGYIQRTNGEYTYKDNATATNQANELSLPNPDLSENKDIIAYLHTHVNDFSYDDPENPVQTITKKGFKIFSPADMVYFMDMIKNAQDAGRPLGDVYAVLVSSLKNYQIRFTGDQSQIKVFTDPQKDGFREPFKDFMKKYSKNLELGFLKFIYERMNLRGISLYRMNSDDTTTEIKLNADKTDTDETNCPSMQLQNKTVNINNIFFILLSYQYYSVR